MSLTFVCPACAARWKIVASPDTRDEAVRCPNCAPKVVDLAAHRRGRGTAGHIGATPAVSAPATSPVTFTITHSSPPGAWPSQS